MTQHRLWESAKPTRLRDYELQTSTRRNFTPQILTFEDGTEAKNPASERRCRAGEGNKVYSRAVYIFSVGPFLRLYDDLGQFGGLDLTYRRCSSGRAVCLSDNPRFALLLHRHLRPEQRQKSERALCHCVFSRVSRGASIHRPLELWICSEWNFSPGLARILLQLH